MTKDMDDVNNGWHQPERLKAYERPQPKPSLHRAIYEPAKERPETDVEHMARDMREGTFPARSERKMVPVTPPEPELLPCPFCGSTPVLSHSPRAVVVGCDNNDCPSRECYSSGLIKNEPRVVERWNTRHQRRHPVESDFFRSGKHDEAIDWIMTNAMAVRRDNGDLDYSLGAMIAAYEAGRASQSTPAADQTLVPTEPTEDMLFAGEEAMEQNVDRGQRWQLKYAWSAMLKAFRPTSAAERSRGHLDKRIFKSALADLVSWFDKPVQGARGMVWVIPAGDQGADDAIAAARSIVGDESP